MKNILLLFITVLSAACTDGNHVQTYRYEEIKTGKCSADPLNTFHYSRSITMEFKGLKQVTILVVCVALAAAFGAAYLRTFLVP